jgi:tricorn protease-like protein
MAIANQNGGFYFINAENGEIIREYYLGHAQTLSLGYIGPQGEMLICGHTFWGGLN